MQNFLIKYGHQYIFKLLPVIKDFQRFIFYKIWINFLPITIYCRI